MVQCNPIQITRCLGSLKIATRSGLLEFLGSNLQDTVTHEVKSVAPSHTVCARSSLSFLVGALQNFVCFFKKCNAPLFNSYL